MKILGCFLVAATMVASCGGRAHRATDDIALDKDVETKILWHMKGDARFDEVRPECADGVVTLRGRVPSRAASDEAFRIALEENRGRRVENMLEIRAK